MVSSDLFMEVDLPQIWPTYSKLTSSKIVKTRAQPLATSLENSILSNQASFY